MCMLEASSPTSHLDLPTSEGTPPAGQSLPPAHLLDRGSREYLQGEVGSSLFTARTGLLSTCPLNA